MEIYVSITRDTRSVKVAQKRLANKTLNPAPKYNDVQYACHREGEYMKGERRGERQTYANICCPFRLQFGATEDNSWS